MAEEDPLKNLFEQHSDSVYRYLLRLTRSHDLASDLVQDTFLRADRFLKQGNQITNERSWLLSIAHNLSVDFFKRESRRRELHDQIEIDYPDQSKLTEWDIMIDQIAERLAREGAVYAQIFLLRIDEGLILKEIAPIVDVPFRSVRRHMEKIRAIITQEFKDFLDSAGQ